MAWLAGWSVLLGWLLCATAGWLGVQAVELRDSSLAPAEALGALAYLTRLALRFSLYASAALAVWHGLRLLLMRVFRHGEVFAIALLALALGLPTWRQAYLLTTGNQIADSAAAVPLRAALFAGLLLSNLGLWALHLWLSQAPGFRLPAAIERLVSKVPAAARLGVALAAGLGTLALLVRELDHGLRQYAFLARFLLPSAWILSSTLLFALYRRLGVRLRLLVCLLATPPLAALTQASPHALTRAQAMFAHTGAIAGLTAVQVSPGQPVAFANLDISHPERFSCDEQRKANAQPLAKRPPNPAHRNVFLISVDALRKDALDARRGNHLVAPSLQALAAESLVFDRAVTSYPATLFALASALTGLSPSEVLFAPRLPDNVLTQTRPRFTRQLVSLPDNYWFSKAIVPRLFTQGAETERGASANDQTSWLIGKLGGALRHKKERVFAWIHYYEPHESLRANSTAEHARDNYLSDVALVDQEIGRLIAYLRKTDYSRDSLIIMFADHGEALGERGYMGHHVYLNRFITDVPLMVYAPGVAPGHSNAMVEIGDIAATILDWTNTASMPTQARPLLPAPDPHAERYAVSDAFPVRGSALFELARNPIRDVRSLMNRIALVQQGAEDYQPKVAITSAGYRLIVNRITGARELYDRVQDPDETSDLADTGLPVQARMLAALAEYSRALSSRIYCRVATQNGR